MPYALSQMYKPKFILHIKQQLKAVDLCARAKTPKQPLVKNNAVTTGTKRSAHAREILVPINYHRKLLIIHQEIPNAHFVFNLCHALIHAFTVSDRQFVNVRHCA